MNHLCGVNGGWPCGHNLTLLSADSTDAAQKGRRILNQGLSSAYLKMIARYKLVCVKGGGGGVRRRKRRDNYFGSGGFETASHTSRDTDGSV